MRPRNEFPLEYSSHNTHTVPVDNEGFHYRQRTLRFPHNVYLQDTSCSLCQARRIALEYFHDRFPLREATGLHRLRNRRLEPVK